MDQSRTCERAPPPPLASHYASLHDTFTPWLIQLQQEQRSNERKIDVDAICEGQKTTNSMLEAVVANQHVIADLLDNGVSGFPASDIRLAPSSFPTPATPQSPPHHSSYEHGLASSDASNSGSIVDAGGLTRDGRARKRKRGVSRLESAPSGMVLMSSDNVTLRDFWSEFTTGRGGKPALRDLELNDKSWRRDPPRVSGEKRSTRFKSFWSYRVPIYNLVTHHIEVDGMTEEDALNEANKTFSKAPVSSRTKKPDLKVVRKLMVEKLKELGF